LTYQISDDSAHDIGSGQRKAALLHDLGRSILGDMAGSNHDLGLVGIGDQIHGTAHTLEYLSWDHVVGQVTVGAHLQGLFN
jgi:HD superfamily phosphodiesterase